MNNQWYYTLFLNGSNLYCKLLNFRPNQATNWPKFGTQYFSHFSQFLARNGPFFLASREKSKTREMCRSTLEYILKLLWFHNSCKQNICDTKCPKTVLFFQFHITRTVGTQVFWFLSRYVLIRLDCFCIACVYLPKLIFQKAEFCSKILKASLTLKS